MTLLHNQKELQKLLARAGNGKFIDRPTNVIAHDFNNILMIMVCNLELRHDHITDKKSDTYMFLNIALRAAETGEELTQELLSFSQKHSPRFFNVPDPYELY